MQRRNVDIGTPAFAKPNELYPQISIINPHLFSSFTPFGETYLFAILTQNYIIPFLVLLFCYF